MLCSDAKLASTPSHDVGHDDETILFNSDADATDEQPASWLIEMIHFLQIGECPLGFDRAKQRYFRV